MVLIDGVLQDFGRDETVFRLRQTVCREGSIEAGRVNFQIIQVLLQHGVFTGEPSIFFFEGKILAGSGGAALHPGGQLVH